ncbi:hypothetical protein V5799_017082 [Amblyomma americanum]|uniref:Abc transporter c family member n=1 Tax=Amblyomma americanum TaxID=6943 RepID=A0AAQ4F397_AMBAM
MDRLVLVDRKRIRVYRNLENLINDQDSPKNFREALEHQESQLQNGNNVYTKGLEENENVGRITGDEIGESQKTGWQLLCSLLRMTQWPAFVGVLVFFGAASASALQQLWIKWWTDASSARDSGGSFPNQPPWVPILVSLCLADVALRIVGSFLLALSMKRLSRSLHNDMLSRVLQSPVSFFDESPRGRIVNRFSTDIDYADARVVLSAKQSVQNTLITLAKVAVVGTQSPVVVGITFVLVSLVAYGMTDVPIAACEKNSSLASTLSRWPHEGMLEFQNYSASYRPGVLPNILNDITFLVRPMEKVGVVGRTGAGKSSLVLALLCMLRASKGRILIDGVDIAEVPLRKLRTSITVIPQDPSLVRGTLLMNLDPTESHSDADILRAVEQSHLSKVVSSDVKGLLLEVTDGGTNLSVGQRQLVCLARALLRGSKVLLLDEATSQMDGDTDRLIQATLRDAFASCTLLTIAHRIHTVLDYDRILVLEEGRVREFDSVSRLLSDPSSAFYTMALEADSFQQGSQPLLVPVADHKDDGRPSPC